MVHLIHGSGDPDVAASGPASDGAAPFINVATLPLPEQVQALTVQVIHSVEGIESLAGEFAQLDAASGNTLPFALYEWQLAWCRYFSRSEPGVIDKPLFHIVRDASSGLCAAIVPLILTERRIGRLKIASIGWLGDDPALTEIRTSLVRPGFEERVAVAVNRSLNEIRNWDWINWAGGLDPFADALERLRGVNWIPVAPSFMLDLAPSWEKFRAGLKRNIRESLRHCYNSLKREGLAYEFQVVSEIGAVQSALERLFILHAMRAELQGTTVHPNRFASIRVRSFMREVCNALAIRGVLRVFQIEIGGHVVASRIGFVVGDSLYLYYSGFDPAWAKYGVMTTTVAEAIKYAIGLGLKTVNLSPGNDVSKTRWSPREVPHYIGYEDSGRLRSRLLSSAYVKARTGSGVEGWLLQRLIPGRRDWS